jgi:Lon protease-like protein
LLRREIIQIFAGAGTCLWAKGLLPASAFLQSSGVIATEKESLRNPPVSQSNQPPEPLLALFPLPLVLFPRTNLALHIFEERYKEMIHDCLQNQWEFGILLARFDAVGTIGCTASISEVVRRYADGRMDILVRGRRRFEISLLNREKSYLRGTSKFFDDDESEAAAEELGQEAIRLHGHLMTLLESEDPRSELPAFSASAEQLSFQIMQGVPADLEWKQGLLELRSERGRLVEVILHLQQLIEFLEKGPAAAAPKGRA